MWERCRSWTEGGGIGKRYAEKCWEEGKKWLREVEMERRRIKGRGEKWDGSGGGRWEGRVEEGESDD